MAGEELICPEVSRVRAMLDGALPQHEQAELALHLKDCETCQKVFEELAGEFNLPSDVAQQPGEPETAVVRVVEKLRAEGPGQWADDGLASGQAADTEQSPDEELSLDFLDPTDDPEQLGRLGEYQITELIGTGGMGTVLKGFDARLNRFVAIKVLNPGLASNATARKRFRREAQAAAAVSHDHVVAIYAVDEAAGLPLLVMEYVDGVSLQQRIKRGGPLELKGILRIAVQTASGLAAAHAQGLVHRDVKPANILLENGVERVKLTDFGLARAVDDVQITRSGVVAGTPEYMSPEQTRGQLVDHRSDLFSFGSVLYAMCTGRAPFRAQTIVDAIRRVCDDEPRPIQEINPEIPDWLVEIIDKLLAKDPCDRFQTASEVAELLGRYLAHVQQPSGVPLPPRLVQPPGRVKDRKSKAIWRRRGALAAAVLFVLIGGLGLAEVSGITDVTGTVIRIVRGDGTLVIEVDDPNVQVFIDGDDLVFTGAGRHEIRLRPGRHQWHATKDGKPLQTESVTISRRGMQVVRVTRQPRVDPQQPMTVRRVWAGPEVDLSGSISPDGRYLSFIHWATGNVAVRDLIDDENRHLTQDGTWDDPNRWAETAVWSPDSRQVAYNWTDEANPGLWQLRTVGLDGSEPRVVYRSGESTYVVPLAWSPDDKRMLVRLSKHHGTNQLGLISLDDGRLEVVKFLDGHGTRWASLSPDGRHVLYDAPATEGSHQHDVFLLDLDKQGEVPLVVHPADDRAALFSPDGKWIVFLTDRSGGEGTWALKIADGESQGEPKWIKENMGRVRPLGFARNGSYYYGARISSLDVYTATLDPQTGKVIEPPTKAVRSFEGSNWAADFSPDGKQLAYLSRRGPRVAGPRSAVLVIHSLEEPGRERELSPKLPGFGPYPAHVMRWSADGQSVLLGALAKKGRHVFCRVNAQDGGATSLLSGKGDYSLPIRSADGKQIFYFRRVDSGSVLAIVARSLKSGGERELFRRQTRGPGLMALSPDGHRLAFFCGDKVLRIISVSGGEARRLWAVPDGDPGLLQGGLVWTRDGKRLLFGKTKTEPLDVVQLWQIPVQGGPPEPVGLEMTRLDHLRIHADGKQILFTGQGSSRGSEVWVMENSLFLSPDGT